MDPHQIKQHLTDLVLDGREELAIEELLAMSNSSSKDVKSNVITLANIYRKFEKDKSVGVLTPDRINSMSDRISQALLGLIEQITEEDEEHRKNIDLEAMFHDIDDIADGKAMRRRKRLIRAASIIIPTVAVLIVGFLAFNGMFSKTTNPGEAALKVWMGEWRHQMQSRGNKEITGNLTFEMVNDDQFIGKARNLFPDGSETTNTLSQIQFSHKGKVIEGIWKTDNIQSLHGTFRLNLDDDNKFAGYYTVVDQEGEFYWNGLKQ